MGRWMSAPTGDTMQSYSQPYGIANGKQLVAGCFGDVAGGPEQAKANAKAIAALPELLEALEMLHFRACSLDQSATHEGLQNCEALAKARAALLAAGYTE